LFRRTKSEPQAPVTPAETSSGKGRPTPSRRQAEAANKARAKVPRTRKEQAAARRGARTDAGAKMREAMRSGDDRFLPERDRGPVRRFVRDYVDSQFSTLELMLPFMVLILVFGYSGSTTLAAFSSLAMPALLLVIVAEGFRLRWRLRRELARRFPDQSTKGTAWYAVMRAVQIRPMRKPDRQVRMGQQLPDRYR
jgi:hypothetical protein